MTNRTRMGAGLAMMLLVGSVFAADTLKSGPQVGQKVAAFNPLNVTGPQAGTRACQV